MKARTWLLLGTVVAAAAIVGVILLSGGGGANNQGGVLAPFPGEPTIDVISPRDGSRHTEGAVVVKVRIRDFQLAPRQFHKMPEFREGFIRFSLKNVPLDVSQSEQQAAGTTGGRVIGRSFDFPRYSGPNGILAEQTGVAGLYSPATLPQIYYHNLPPGYYRLIILLAENDGSPTPFHSVTHFTIEPPS